MQREAQMIIKLVSEHLCSIISSKYYRFTSVAMLTYHYAVLITVKNLNLEKPKNRYRVRQA